MVETLQQGAQDYLVKSDINREGLEFAIHSAIEKVSLRRELDDKQRRLERQTKVVELKNKQLHQLASQLTLAEQRERHRVAQLLHDDLQQQLFGVQILLRSLQRDAADPVKPRLEEAYAQLSDAVRTAKSLTVDLSPPILKGEGLSEALGWLGTQMLERYNLKVQVKKRLAAITLSEAMRVLLFNLVRELLFNTVKHAQTERAEVELAQDDHSLLITVKDRGAGFEVATLAERETQGFGLYSVRERLELFGGQLHIVSAPGEGTTITISVPLKAL